jgi:hypothetical protein
MNGTLEGLTSVKGTFLGLGRSRGRDLVENQDNCRKISMGCEFFSKL